MAGLFVKKGDTVQVIAGRDKGLKGKVIMSLPGRDAVLVEGAGRITRHTKLSQSARGSQQGGIVTQESPVHVSKVQVVCPSCGKPSRVGHRRSEPDAAGKTRSIRICRRCDSDL